MKKIVLFFLFLSQAIFCSEKKSSVLKEVLSCIKEAAPKERSCHHVLWVGACACCSAYKCGFSCGGCTPLSGACCCLAAAYCACHSPRAFVEAAFLVISTEPKPTD